MLKARHLLLAGAIAPFMMGAAPSTASAVSALRAGASDVLDAPVLLVQADPEELLRRRLEELQGEGAGNDERRQRRQEGRDGRGDEQREQRGERRPERAEEPRGAEEQPRRERQSEERQAEEPREERRERQDQSGERPALRERVERERPAEAQEQPREERRQEQPREERPRRAEEPRAPAGRGETARPEAPPAETPRQQDSAGPERRDLRERLETREPDAAPPAERERRRDNAEDRDQRRQERPREGSAQQDQSPARQLEQALPEKVLEELRIAPAEERADRLREQAREERVRERGGRDGDRDRSRLDRREVLDERDGRTLIRDGENRIIIRENNRVIIRNDDDHRLARDAEDIRVERRRNGETVTTIVRDGGVEIVTIRDEYGNIVERIRRDRRGRETVLIDNRRSGRGGFFGQRIELPPLVIGIPRERYVVEVEEAPYEYIEEAFAAPPVEQIERPYSLDEVRYNYRLLEKVRSVELNTVTFETGRWDIPEDQIDRLDSIGQALEEAIERNPDEIFMIEGHTDAVGSNEDNLALSDRRAETVAMILTEYFDVPAENLVTQGFGEEQLKVRTTSAERENRRVVIRRITPLLTSQR